MKTQTSAIEPRGDEGFTLVEALCGLTILAIGFVSLFQGLNGAQRNSNRLSELASERQIVRSLVSETGVQPRIGHRSKRGQNGAFRWTITQVPLRAGLASPAPLDRWQPYAVTYEVRGPHNVYSVTSVRLLAAR